MSLLLTVVTPSHLHLGVGPAVRGVSQKLNGLCRWQDRTLGVGAGVPGVGALMSVSTLLSPSGPSVAERRAMGG